MCPGLLRKLSVLLRTCNGAAVGRFAKGFVLQSDDSLRMFKQPLLSTHEVCLQVREGASSLSTC